MQFVTVTLGLFAALTTAYSHPRHPHFVYKRQNTTSSVTAQSVAASDAAGLTTLTVLTTSVHTVISCAATITDCPANSADLSTLPASALSTVVVTQTIELATTVCPVTEASSISTSILSAHESGSLPGVTRSAAVDTATITAAPDATSSADAIASESECSTDFTEVVVSESVETLSSTNAITMTLGGGNGGRVVTTTITKKVKSTHYVTKTVVHTSSAAAAQVTSGNSAVGDNSGSDSGADSQDTTIDGTTTTTAYTTGTRTVTVKKASTQTATAQAGSGSGSSGSGSSGSGSSGSSEDDTGACSCPAADQVTVTLPAQTLYVTMTVTAGSAAETVANNNAAKPDTTTTEEAAAATTTDASDAEETESECPPEVVVTATVVPQFTLSNSSTTATATGTGAAAATNGLKFRRSNMLYH